MPIKSHHIDDKIKSSKDLTFVNRIDFLHLFSSMCLLHRSLLMRTNDIDVKKFVRNSITIQTYFFLPVNHFFILHNVL